MVLCPHAWVAQLVEHFPEEEGVTGSNPVPSTTMTLATRFDAVLAFAARNERKLGAALFAFGFLTDLLTFTLLPLPYINIFFASYLVLVAVCTFGANLIMRFNAQDVWWRKTLAVVFPLGVQYALGGLLSGFVVFYASHSVIAVSWPFLLLLILVYVGNEYYRKQREHLIFQTALFYFALYAYAIFALPLFVGTIGPWVFLGSTVAALIIFALFLYLLYVVNKTRSQENLKPAGKAAIGITLLVSLAYFTGAIPPLPLALADSGVYHAVTYQAGAYVLQSEAPRPWWHLGTPEVHITPGDPLYAFSAVVAPASFGSTVVHRWERSTENGWVTENVVAFPISGGRQGGYRGYSEKTNVTPGLWRVSIETAGGQVIGRFGFSVAAVETTPPLEAVVR